MRNKIQGLLSVCSIIVTCFIISGCANIQIGFNFNADGTITQQNLFEIKSSLKQFGDYKNDIAKKKQDDIKDGFQIKDTPDGYIATKTYKNIYELVNLTLFQPNSAHDTKGVQVKKGLLYDYYHIEIFIKGQENDAPKPNYQANIPSFFSPSVNMNVWEYENYRRQAEAEAREMNKMADQAIQGAIDAARMDFTITLPYAVEFTNARIKSNDEKSLTWDIKPAFLKNRDMTMKATFRIYHQNTIVALYIVEGIWTITAVVFLVLSIVKWSDMKKRKMFLGVFTTLILIIVGTAAWAKYSVDHPPSFTDDDCIIIQESNPKNANKGIPPNKNTVPSNNKNIKQDDKSLAQANLVIKNKGFSYQISAISRMDEDGFFGLLTGKGVAFVIYDKKDDLVAMVDFDKKILNLKTNKYEGSKDMYQPLIFKMQIENADRNNRDKNLGSWNGSTHILPIYAQYGVNEDNEIVPGMLTSGGGENPSHYQGYLQEQSSVNLANILLTHADSLKADIEEREISLP